MRTAERIQKIEKEIETIRHILEDEILWHPSRIREIQRRSRVAHRDYSKGRLRKIDEVLA